ncbi:hypothetical protein EJV47_16195 [Hymenobacter gummosus]|uniref:Uncharacterized protein n=1 Tax=Hymenobacter gummosus TaxID=1776032 RepID=A0A431U0Q8_9BACT|nr:hypothetical protein [Hymenobacter gummosus]RTQ48511.1 hypothetical protein EJV47_16195 [Hymenobacter gummosus]
MITPPTVPVAHPEYIHNPCLACRRPLRLNGQQAFTTCSCLNYGRSVTVAALAAGVGAVALLGLLWLSRRG